jgi:hypothetical protein
MPLNFKNKISSYLNVPFPTPSISLIDLGHGPENQNSFSSKFSHCLYFNQKKNKQKVVTGDGSGK